MPLSVYTTMLMLLIGALTNCVSSYKVLPLDYVRKSRMPMMPLSPPLTLPGPEWRAEPPFKGLNRNMMLTRKMNPRIGRWFKGLQKFPVVNMRRSTFDKMEFDDDDDFRHNMLSRDFIRRYPKGKLFRNPRVNSPRRRLTLPNFKKPFINQRFKRPNAKRLDNVFHVTKHKYMNANGHFNNRLNVVRRLRTQASHQRQMRPYQDEGFRDDFIEDYSDSFDDRPYENDNDNVYNALDRGLHRSVPVLPAVENIYRDSYSQSLTRSVQAPSAQQFQNQGFTGNHGEHLAYNSAVNGMQEGRGVSLNFALSRQRMNVNGVDQEKQQIKSWNLNSNVALRNTDFPSSIGNNLRGDAQLPMTFGQSLIDNIDLNNQHMSQQNIQNVAENAPHTFANNQVKQSAPDKLQVFPVNPFTNDQPGLVIGIDDSRDIDQATFALLGIEPSSVNLNPADQLIHDTPTPQVNEPLVAPNSWRKSEMLDLSLVSQNNKIMSAQPIQEQAHNTNIDDPLVNKDVHSEKNILPNVKVKGDNTMIHVDPPAIYVPVSENTLMKEQTLSNMINMSQDMLQTDTVPSMQLGTNENNKMSTTNDHSVVNSDLTANTFKDRFANLDHLNFGFDSFEEDIINHNIVN